jgi:hypothetical protein
MFSQRTATRPPTLTSETLQGFWTGQGAEESPFGPDTPTI